MIKVYLKKKISERLSSLDRNTQWEGMKCEWSVKFETLTVRQMFVWCEVLRYVMCEVSTVRYVLCVYDEMIRKMESVMVVVN